MVERGLRTRFPRGDPKIRPEAGCHLIIILAGLAKAGAAAVALAPKK
jgi:hypothetical protein